MVWPVLRNFDSVRVGTVISSIEVFGFAVLVDSVLLTWLAMATLVGRAMFGRRGPLFR